MMTLVACVLFVASCFGIGMVLGGYPLLITMWSALVGSRPHALPVDMPLPSLSLLVIARNAEGLIRDKLDNSLGLDYPRHLLEIIVCSDGSTDRTAEIMREYQAENLHCLCFEEHHGKIHALNEAARTATGEILVFSDADALLDAAALRMLVRHFADPKVGGVCGQRRIARDAAAMSSAQAHYIGLDSRIKSMESRLGRISANDGKLYALRASLHRPIATGVTDDLYACLSVVRQGAFFLFEPAAVAWIKVPSRTMRHEFLRRQRIVTQSLRGIYLHRSLLNPFRHGLFAIGLFVNKILRRLLPVMFLVILMTTGYLALVWPLMGWLLLLQMVGYAAALAALLLSPHVARLRLARPVRKVIELLSYFCVGNAGTLLGIIAFVNGETVEKWNPVKSD